MVKVLLTGGSGFIAAHVLEGLLKNGHTVVTTVRSQSKADKIIEAHSDYKKQLSTVIVEDIAVEGAFDEAVKSDPPFEAVVHTASPFHFDTSDVEKNFLNPAIIGTTGVLKSIKKSAPSVKRVVITSSFASIVNPYKGMWPGHTYSEEDWSPMTREKALEDPANGYRASKTLAEQAAWDFVKNEKPNFSVATLCPPLVYGPIVNYLNSLDSVNTSNARFRDIIQGKWKDEVPPTNPVLWVDVRDIADAHVAAMEREDAANKRFFVTAGYHSNTEIVKAIRENFPEYKDKLPSEETAANGKMPEEVYGFDNKRSIDVLGLKYRPLAQCVVDTVKSLQKVGA